MCCSSDDPVVWNGTTLYFRGFRILDAVIDAILAVGGENIEDVIVTGCSGNYYYNYIVELLLKDTPNKGHCTFNLSIKEKIFGLYRTKW